MEIPKPTEDDKQFFRSILPEDPEVEVKPMFGNLGAFVHGNMFAGLFGSAVGVRLAGPDAAELSAVEGTGPFGPAERPMGSYLSLPSGMAPDQATRGVGKARSHVGSLPPKKPKPRKARAGWAGWSAPAPGIGAGVRSGGGLAQPAEEVPPAGAVDRRLVRRETPVDQAEACAGPG